MHFFLAILFPFVLIIFIENVTPVIFIENVITCSEMTAVVLLSLTQHELLDNVNQIVLATPVHTD